MSDKKLVCICKMKVIFDTFQKISFPVQIGHFAVVTLLVAEVFITEWIWNSHIVMLLSPCVGIRISTELFQLLFCINLSLRLAKNSSLNYNCHLVTCTSLGRKVHCWMYILRNWEMLLTWALYTVILNSSRLTWDNTFIAECIANIQNKHIYIFSDGLTHMVHELSRRLGK